MAEKKKKKGILRKLFPAWFNYESDPTAVDSQVSGTTTKDELSAVMADPYTGRVFSSTQLMDAESKDACDSNAFSIQALPFDRMARYPVFQVMNMDATIAAALRHHVINALSVKEDTNECVFIESTTDEDNKYVNDLRDTFKEIINKRSHEIAYSAGMYGITFARVYGKPGVGITDIRHDYYTYPGHTAMWEQANRLAGWTNFFQNHSHEGHIRLMEPWKFLRFRIPLWESQGISEPVRTSGRPFDIDNEDLDKEDIVESQNYGESLLSKAFYPWYDLQEAILSLNMSRKNASRLERLFGVNTGGLQPQKAQKYLNIISDQLLRNNKTNQRQSLRRGWIPTVINHLIPIWSKDGKGRLEVSSVDGKPDIAAIEDIMFHVKRLCASIGTEPGLLGFGEQLSGGLGEGGWNRISIMEALFSTLIRSAMRNGWNDLFDLHIAWKFNKHFLPGQKPWRLVFNSVSTALEREKQENDERRINFATGFAALVDMLDPEKIFVEKPNYHNYVMTDILKIDEEKSKEIFNRKPSKEEEEMALGMGGPDMMGGGGPGGGMGGPPDAQVPVEPSDDEKEINESVGASKADVYRIIQDFYEQA